VARDAAWLNCTSSFQRWLSALYSDQVIVCAISIAGLASAGWAQPLPTSFDHLSESGPILAKTGQTIDGLLIANPSGPCVVIREGVENVTIQNSRIGPCGVNGVNDYGVWILEGARNIRIQGNVFHDVATGVKAYKAVHPIIVEKNFFYNVRGPAWSGQAVQFNGVTGTGGSSRVSCNVSDATYGIGPSHYEDHISIFDSHGTGEYPIEVTANRVRGGTSRTGGGITVGDKGGSWIAVRRNVVVKVANSGIGVAGGYHISIEDNIVDNRGEGDSSLTHMAYYVRALSPCANILVRGNHGIARLWNWNEIQGKLVPGYRHGPERCDLVDDSGNYFGDASIPGDIFDKIPRECQ
jgi:hypothetical protein